MKNNPVSRFRDLSELGKDPTSWTHIAPRGEFPGLIEIPAGYDVPGYGVAAEPMQVNGVTVFDDRTLESMVQRFDGDVLIDQDHLSHDQDKSTEAMGWGRGLRYTAGRDGLELETAWTPPGREKISTKVYRFISPEFSGSVRYEGGVFKFYPSALVGAGLTNRPKLQVLRPVSSNRTIAQGRESSSAAPVDQAMALENQAHAYARSVMRRDKCTFAQAWDIAKMERPDLFDPADDDDETGSQSDAAFAEVAKVKNREKCDFQTAWTMARAENPKLFERCTKTPARSPEDVSRRTLADDLTSSSVEDFNGHVAFVRNRRNCTFGEAWNIAACEKPELFEKLIRTGSGQPGPTVRDRQSDSEEDRRATMASAFVATVKNREKCRFETAWEIAKRERPELFA